MRYGAAAAALAAGLLAAAPSGAYQRTQTCDSYGTFACEEGEEPKPIAWKRRCVRYRINRNGSDDFSGGGRLSDDVREHVRTAFRAWGAPSCTDLHLVSGGPTEESRAEYDRSKGWAGNENLVVWRGDEWPYARGHSFALTSVTYEVDDGRIVDADIELNDAWTTFAHLERSRVGETEKVDLVNALTHEVGHFIGLGHSKREEATMYRSANPGEISKRTLHADDIDGVCAIYPAGEDPAQCEDPSSFRPSGGSRGLGGCRCSTRGNAPGGGLGAVVWAGIVFAGTRFRNGGGALR